MLKVGYYFWLIGGSISFSLSGIGIISTIHNADFRKIPSILLIIYLLGDIMQCGSWFFGPKINTHGNICAYQELLFEIGIISKCYSCAAGIWILSLWSTTINIDSSREIRFRLIWAAAALFTCIIILIVFHSYDVICDNGNEMRDASQNLAFGLCYCFPVVLMLLHTQYRAVKVIFSLNDGETSIFQIQLSQTIFIIAVLFTLLLWPPILMYAVLISTQRINLTLYCTAAVSLSLTGVLVSVKVLLSPLLDRIRLSTPWGHRFVDETSTNPSIESFLPPTLPPTDTNAYTHPYAYEPPAPHPHQHLAPSQRNLPREWEARVGG
jgi:hypothetical protein